MQSYKAKLFKLYNRDSFPTDESTYLQNEKVNDSHFADLTDDEEEQMQSRNIQHVHWKKQVNPFLKAQAAVLSATTWWNQ